METISLTIKSATSLKTTQRAIDRIMVGISLKVSVINLEIRKRNGGEDVMERVANGDGQGKKKPNGKIGRPPRR